MCPPKDRGTTEEAKSAPEREYCSALKALWEGRPRTAIERLTTSISMHELSPSMIKYYRLWIEVLAVQKEYAALVHLKVHLSRLPIPGKQLGTSFMALQGLIHLELDEVDAATVCLNSCRKGSKDPWVAELQSMIDLRTEPVPPLSGLWKMWNNLEDYFHYENLAKNLLLRSDDSRVRKVIAVMKDLFPLTPFPAELEMQLLVDQKEYGKAVHCARLLFEIYPNSLKFGFQLGYLLCRSGQYGDAAEVFEKVDDLHSPRDPDVLNWWGYSLLKRAVQESDDKVFTLAERVLKDAVYTLSEAGLPVDFPAGQLRELQSIKQGTSVENQTRRIWMVKLDHQDWHHMRTAGEDHITRVKRSFCTGARAGDLCFMFGEDTINGADSWRLGAIYTLASDPVWHPLGKYQVDLTLINRPGLAIPVPIRQFGAGHDKQKSVFEVKPSALESIAGVLEEFDGTASDLKDAVSFFQKSIS